MIFYAELKVDVLLRGVSLPRNSINIGSSVGHGQFQMALLPIVVPYKMKQSSNRLLQD